MNTMEDLHVTDTITIPGAEIGERFSTSGGPGGQHANRSATRVVLTFDVGSSRALDDAVRARLHGWPRFTAAGRATGHHG